MGRRRAEKLLTSRQFACLQGVADHLDSIQIAERLKISEHTVNGHLALVMKKLGAHTRRDAVRRYLALQLETPEEMTGQFLVVGSETAEPPQSAPGVVNEPDAPAWEPFPVAVDEQPKAARHDMTTHLQTIAIILGIAIAAIVLAVALDPLARSAVSIGKLIHKPHH